MGWSLNRRAEHKYLRLQWLKEVPNSMKHTLAIAKQSLKRLLESLFPEATYKRRYRLWLKNEREVRLLPAICRTDATSVDIGANEGFFAGHLLPVSQHVVAFEPLPQMLSRLRARYGSTIEIIDVILSDKAGEGELTYQAGGYMTATIEKTNVTALK
jgi:hypothetical protein